MVITRVGIVSPGDMGHAVGARLQEHGVRPLTTLEGRSARTRALAQAAGFEDVGSMEGLVQSADVILSIVVPASAHAVALRVAEAIKAAGASVLYADCNAVAPSTACAIGRAIVEAGGRFADAGIIGPPPRRPGTRFYASGPGASELAQLNDHGLDVRVLDDVVGHASGLKMCYAAMTKGLLALATELLVAARAMGLDGPLRAEQGGSLSGVLDYVTTALPGMPPKAHRWVGEMEEIARSFEEVGLPPGLMLGAADVYRFVAGSPLGAETPESQDSSRDMDGVVARLAEALPSAKLPMGGR